MANLGLSCAIKFHFPEVHFAVNLAAKENPLAVRGNCYFCIIVFVVSKALLILTVKIRHIKLCSLGINSWVRPVTFWHIKVIFCRSPYYVFAVRAKIIAGIFTLIIDAADICSVNICCIGMVSVGFNSWVARQLCLADNTLAVRRKI